jgi:hypothetical protein
MTAYVRDADTELFEIAQQFNSLGLLERHVLRGNEASMASLRPQWRAAGDPDQIVLSDMRIDKQAVAQEIIASGLAYRVSVVFARSLEYLGIRLDDVYPETLDRLAPRR